MCYQLTWVAKWSANNSIIMEIWIIPSPIVPILYLDFISSVGQLSVLPQLAPLMSTDPLTNPNNRPAIRNIHTWSTTPGQNNESLGQLTSPMTSQKNHSKHIQPLELIAKGKYWTLNQKRSYIKISKSCFMESSKSSTKSKVPVHVFNWQLNNFYYCKPKTGKRQLMFATKPSPNPSCYNNHVIWTGLRLEIFTTTILSRSSRKFLARK